MKSRNVIFLFSLFLGASSVSWAVGPSLLYSHTTGSMGFDGDDVNATLNLQSGFFLGAEYSSYHSDNSSGTIKTYGGRLGRYTDKGSWQLFGSATPDVNGYQAVDGGAEIRHAIFGGGETAQEPLPSVSMEQKTSTISPGWHANPELDFIAGYERDMFKDQGEKINENDLTGGLAFDLFKTELKGTFTKSVYDQEISGDINPSAHRFSIGYGPTILPGYPNYDYSASIDQTLLPGWWLLGTATHIQFKTSPDDQANVLTVGMGITLFHVVTAMASYTRYLPNNQPNENFLSIGGGLVF